MRQDITGQPEPGVIGGIPDLSTAIATVNRNFTSANQAIIPEGFTSFEQGRDYDAAAETKAQTLTADTPEKNIGKNIPWALVLAGGFILWAIFKGAK